MGPHEPPAAADARPWILVGVIQVSLFGLAEDVCRVSLERGDTTDVLHLRYDEFGTDRDLELPATPGSETDAARAALAGASAEGHFDSTSVVTGGLLTARSARRSSRPDTLSGIPLDNGTGGRCRGS